MLHYYYYYIYQLQAIGARETGMAAYWYGEEKPNRLLAIAIGARATGMAA
jgi:hypothetical protein